MVLTIIWVIVIVFIGMEVAPTRRERRDRLLWCEITPAMASRRPNYVPPALLPRFTSPPSLSRPRRAMLTLTPPPPEPPQAARQPGTSGADGGGGGAVGETATAATGVPPEAAAASRVGGVAVATCCHHVCNWRDYAGREFLSRQVSDTL